MVCKLYLSEPVKEKHIFTKENYKIFPLNIVTLKERFKCFRDLNVLSILFKWFQNQNIKKQRYSLKLKQNNRTKTV